MEIIVKEKIVPNEKNEADTANPENAIFSGKEVSPCDKKIVEGGVKTENVSDGNEPTTDIGEKSACDEKLHVYPNDPAVNFPPSNENKIPAGGYTQSGYGERILKNDKPIFKEEMPKNGASLTKTVGKEPVFGRETADKASVIFGQSEEEMRREFRAFKAAKLFKKFDCDLTDVYSPELLDQKLSEAKNFGFGAVVVTPQKIKIAKERLKGTGIEVVAAVCFPLGEEVFGVKKYAVKKAAEKGADRIYVPVGVSAVKFNATDRLKREFKGIVRAAKKKKVSAVLESGMLTAQETERTVRILNSVKVMSFVSSAGGNGMNDGISAVKNIRYFLRSGSEVCGFTASRRSDEAVGLMSVADRLFVKNAADLASDIRANLKY